LLQRHYFWRPEIETMCGVEWDVGLATAAESGEARALVQASKYGHDLHPPAIKLVQKQAEGLKCRKLAAHNPATACGYAGSSNSGKDRGQRRAGGRGKRAALTG
jgi:hypothetical protein